MPFVKCPECGKLNSVKLKNCPKCEASLEIVRMSVDNTQPAGGFNAGVPQPQATPWGQPAQPQPMPQNNPWGQPAQQPAARPQGNPWGGQPIQQPLQQPRNNPWGQPAQHHAAQQPMRPQGNPWSQPVQPHQPNTNPWGQPVQPQSMPQNNPWGQPVQQPAQPAMQQPAGNPWGGQPVTPNNAAPTHCSNCGTQLMPGAGFCGVCGRPVAGQQPSGIPVRKNPYCR